MKNLSGQRLSTHAWTQLTTAHLVFLWPSLAGVDPCLVLGVAILKLTQAWNQAVFSLSVSANIYSCTERRDVGLGLCCVRLHCAGTVWATLSLHSLAITRLLRKRGKNSSPKTVPSCSSTQHLPSLLLKCNLNGQFDGPSASCPLAQVHVRVSKSYVFISRRLHRRTNRLWRQIRLPYWSSPTNQTAKYTDLKRGVNTVV